MAYGPPEPRWTRDNPRLYNARRPGYRHLPSFAMSKPGSTALDVRRSMALGLRRRCAVCGCTMGDVVWATFHAHGGSESSKIRDNEQEGMARWHPGDVWTDNTPGPTHKSCAVYASIVCPFLRTRWSRRHGGGRRGEAAIFGFRKYGIAYFDEPLDLIGDGLGDITHIWGYAEPYLRISYETFKDTVKLYDDVLAEDDWIDTSTRLYWDENRNRRELGQLRMLSAADKDFIAAMRPNAIYRAPTGHTYRLAVL